MNKTNEKFNKQINAQKTQNCFSVSCCCSTSVAKVIVNFSSRFILCFCVSIHITTASLDDLKSQLPNCIFTLPKNTYLYVVDEIVIYL